MTSESQPIVNARMYSVSAEVAALWRNLLSALISTSGASAAVIDHPAPAPLAELWNRPDKAAVFMCGLPFSRAEPQPLLIAAPVPTAAEFNGQPEYWSEFVVRDAGPYRTLEDTYGSRIAFTVPDSQSGCIAALDHFMSLPRPDGPLFRAVIAPTLTPSGNLSAVVKGAADVAPIDAYALRLLRVYRPDLCARIRVIGRTASTPIPPLVASRPSPALQAAFLGAHETESMRPLLDKLLLQRFALPDAGAYTRLKQRFAATMEYWTQHRIAATIHPEFNALT